MSRLSLLLLAPLLALAACGANGDDASTGGSLADKVTREIREEMANESLDLGRGDDQPPAELTPEGELIIGGKAVGLDASQRELAMAYRADVAAIAEHGARIGMEAADLAKESVGMAIQGLFTGEGTEAVEKHAETKAKDIEVAARALCDRLPALYQSQQALAAAVPEFVPYANMDESDIDDCHVDTH